MKLSLCIIARNEESMLAGCLESVRGIVDEIVLVDTGSKDGTIRIAEKHGARVFKSPWRDDFSAPRNLSIARARGEWILQLDADERLAPGAGDAIRKAIDGAEFDCGLIRLHNATRGDAPHADVIAGKERLGEAMSLPRLLRRTSDLKYEGIVHESILRWLRDRGNRVSFVDADIVHLGSTAELRRDRNKVSRNVELLKRRAESEPNDPTAWSYIAFEALAQGEFDEAWAAADKGWEIALRGEYPAGTSLLRLAVARALVQKQRGEHHGVLETVRIGERLDGKHPDLCMLRGMTHEMLALAAGPTSKLRQTHLKAALAAHGAALSLASIDYVQRFLVGAGSWGSKLRAGLVLLQLGDPMTAREALRSSLAERPGEVETKLAMAEAEIECGAADIALCRLEPLLGEQPDAWVLGSLACDRIGAVDDALSFIRQAGHLTKAGYLAPHRRELHLDLMALAGAYAGSPSAGPGPIGALTALMAKKPFEGTQSGDVARLPMRSIVSNLVVKKRFAELDALLTARAEHAFPGLAAAIAAALQSMGMSVDSDDAPIPILVACESCQAAAVVARVLAAHPRAVARGSMSDAKDAAPGDSVREIFTVGSIARAIELAKELPRATMLLVSADAPSNELRSEIESQGLGERTVELSYRDLLDAPTATFAHLFAALGEADDDGPLRALIDTYPGRSRDFSAFTPDDRERRATRSSPCPARGVAREVSP